MSEQYYLVPTKEYLDDLLAGINTATINEMSDDIDALRADVDAHVGAGGTAHANAVPDGAAGFMPGADKAKLDALALPTITAQAATVPGDSAAYPVGVTMFGVSGGIPAGYPADGLVVTAKHSSNRVIQILYPSDGSFSRTRNWTTSWSAFSAAAESSSYSVGLARAVSRLTVLRLRERVFISDFGTVSAATNSAQTVKNAIDTCYEWGGRSLETGATRILLQEQIDIRSNVQIVGEARHTPEVITSGGTEAVQMSSLNNGVFLIDHTAGDAFRLRGNSAGLIGITAYYPGQVAPSASTPVVYPPTVGLYPENVRSPTVKNCFFPNSYEMIVFDEANNRPTVIGIRGGAYKTGITIDASASVPKIRDCQLGIWYDYIHGLTEGQPIDEYVKNNLTAYAFGRGAWFQAQNLFVYKAKTGLHLFPGTAVGASTERVPNGYLHGFGADDVGTGIFSDGTKDQDGFYITNASIFCGHGDGNGIRTRATTVDGTTYSSRLSVSGKNVGGSGLVRGVLHATGELHLRDIKFVSAASNSGVRADVGMGTLHMSDCDIRLGTTRLSLATAIPGSVFLSGNDLDGTGYTPPATLPTVYRAGGNNGIPSSGW